MGYLFTRCVDFSETCHRYLPHQWPFLKRFLRSNIFKVKGQRSRSYVYRCVNAVTVEAHIVDGVALGLTCLTLIEICALLLTEHSRFISYVVSYRDGAFHCRMSATVYQGWKNSLCLGCRYRGGMVHYRLCLVNLLLHNIPHRVVHRIQIRTVGWSQ